jgi:hypothetical protein
MATPGLPYSSTARRAEILREAWRPVGQRVRKGAGGVIDFLSVYPPVAQGVYYLLIGLWPWVAASSYQFLTGTRSDLWLVQSLGALLVIIGIALCVAGYRHEKSWAVVCLALGTAATLAFLDVYFVTQRRIALGYLLDAAVEVGLVVLWIYSWRSGRNELTRETRQAPLALPVAQVAAGPPPAARG